MNEEFKPLLTAEDHEAGFKDLEVTFRSGKKETVRLHAPPHRVAQQLMGALIKSGDTQGVILRCLGKPDDEGLRLLDRLAPDSAVALENYSFALTFGEEFLKKSQALARRLMNARPTDSTSPENVSASSAPATPGA